MSARDDQDRASQCPDACAERSVLTVIRSIQNGTLEPKSLTSDDRRRCVEHLTGEGYSVVEIAEIFNVRERTIARDRAAIRKSNAIHQDPKLVTECVGQLVHQAETAINRIRRVTRERGVPASARIDGEKACWVIANQLTARLQALGYLPTAAQQIRGEISHRLEDSPGYDQILEEVARVEVIVAEDGGLPNGTPSLKELAQVKDEITRLQLSDRVRRLAAGAEEGGITDDRAPNE